MSQQGLTTGMGALAAAVWEGRLWCGISFFGGFQHPPVDGCSMVSCDLDVLAEDEHMFFYSTILNQNLLVTWCCNFCVFTSC